MIESSGGIFRLVKSWNSKVPEVFYHATVPRVTFQKARVSSAVCFMGKSQYNYCTLFLLKVICFEIVNISSHSLHIFYFPTLQKSGHSHLVGIFQPFFVYLFSIFTLLGKNGLLTDVRHGRPVTFRGKLLNMVMWGASWAVLPTSEKSESVFPMGFPSKGGMSLSPM